MKGMNVNDFIRYAKEEFGCDISLKKTDKPDSFDTIFGTCRKKAKKGEKSIMKYDKKADRALSLAIIVLQVAQIILRRKNNLNK